MRIIKKIKLKLFGSLLLVMTALHGNAQVIADPATGQMDITDLAGASLNANFIAPGEVLNLKVPLYNLNQLIGLPPGTCRFVITLGNNMALHPSFTAATGPLSNYFVWSTAIVGGNVQLTGTLFNRLPEDFYTTMEFKVVATAALGFSSMEANFLITNHSTDTPLTDEDPNNNYATLSYTVTLATLPVTLKNLALVKNGCDLQLNFTAADEVNVKRYEIQYSKNGLTFLRLGEVAANTSIYYKYNFPLSDSLVTPILFIRIKSIDNDGSFAYSNVTQTTGKCTDTNEGIKLYPNPVERYSNEIMIANTNTRSLFNGHYNLALRDMTGKLLNNTKLKMVNASKIIYQAGHLASGKYLLSITDKNGETVSVPFYKL